MTPDRAMPLLSVVVPAHNEAFELPRTLAALRSALAEAGCPSELLVVDDSSTDATAALAEAGGARVVRTEVRQIAAARNAGAREAKGEWLLFVDADTRVPVESLRSALKALAAGAVGGGAAVRWEPPAPLHGRVYLWLFNLVWRPLGYAAGCFVFARRSDFDVVGGFDEAYFAGEEVWLSRALRARGRFVVVREPVLTSARKVRMNTTLGMFWTALRLLLAGPRGCRRREGLELWYDGRREAGPPGAPDVQGKG